MDTLPENTYDIFREVTAAFYADFPGHLASLPPPAHTLHQAISRYYATYYASNQDNLHCFIRDVANITADQLDPASAEYAIWVVGIASFTNKQVVITQAIKQQRPYFPQYPCTEPLKHIPSAALAANAARDHHPHTQAYIAVLLHNYCLSISYPDGRQDTPPELLPIIEKITHLLESATTYHINLPSPLWQFLYTHSTIPAILFNHTQTDVYTETVNSNLAAYVNYLASNNPSFDGIMTAHASHAAFASTEYVEHPRAQTRSKNHHATIHGIVPFLINAPPLTPVAILHAMLSTDMDDDDDIWSAQMPSAPRHTPMSEDEQLARAIQLSMMDSTQAPNVFADIPEPSPHSSVPFDVGQLFADLGNPTPQHTVAYSLDTGTTINEEDDPDLQAALRASMLDTQPVFNPKPARPQSPVSFPSAVAQPFTFVSPVTHSFSFGAAPSRKPRQPTGLYSDRRKPPRNTGRLEIDTIEMYVISPTATTASPITQTIEITHLLVNNDISSACIKDVAAIVNSATLNRQLVKTNTDHFIAFYSTDTNAGEYNTKATDWLNRRIYGSACFIPIVAATAQFDPPSTQNATGPPNRTIVFIQELSPIVVPTFNSRPQYFDSSATFGDQFPQ